MTRFPISPLLTAPLTGAVLLAASCAPASPPSDPRLQSAQSELQSLQNDSAAVRHAQTALREAEQAVADLETAVTQAAAAERVAHLAFLAERRIDIAETIAQTGRLQEEVSALEEQRERIVANARQADLDRARERAAQAEEQAASASEQAERAAEQAAQAEAARQAAEERAEELERALEETLSELDSERTARGLVITLQDDVLFDVDSTEVKPGGREQLERVAEALQQGSLAERDIIVEGHTDSTGSSTYNEGLSLRRAEAVRAILVDNGVAPGRISATGFGESRPVASNDTAAGRQENRRVEIVATK